MDGSLRLVRCLAWAAGLLAVAFARGQERLPERRELLDLIEYRDTPLSDVIRQFSEETGLKIVPSAKALETKITLYLTDVPAQAALESLARQAGLWPRRDPATGIIHIYTADEYRVDLTAFREERTEVFTLLYPNPIDVAAAVRDTFGERVQLSYGASEDQGFQDLTERFDRFDLVDGRSQGLGLFQGTSGRGVGGGAVGTGTSRDGYSGYGRGGPAGRRSDFLRQGRTSDGSERLPVQRLQDLQQQGRSVFEIEALEKILEKQQKGEKVDQSLIDKVFPPRQTSIYVTVIRRQNQIVVRTSDERAMEQIRELIAKLDVPTPLVLLEVKVLQIDLSDDFRSVFDYQFSDGKAAGGFTTGDILPPAGNAINQSIAPLGAVLKQGDFTFQYVSASFRARMQLLEDKNRVTVLSTPLLLTANNEVSRLFVGREVPLNRSFTGPQPIPNTAVDNLNVPNNVNYGAGSTEIEFRPVGTTLLITPNINADRTVTLRILQEMSEVRERDARVFVPTNTGFNEVLLDVVESRNVSGTVVAKDALTVAIGGLISEQASDNRQAVPVVGRIPVLGFFFRRQETGREKRELVILIRPYVFNAPCDASAISQDVLQELSIHPTTLDGDPSLHSFAPAEAVRPSPAMSKLQNTFRYHSVRPITY